MEALEIEEGEEPSSFSLPTVQSGDSEELKKDVQDEEEQTVAGTTKKTWKLFKKKKRVGSKASVGKSPKLLVRLRRKEKTRSMSDNIIVNKTLNNTLGTSRVLSEKARETSFLFDDRSVVSTNTNPRVRSTSSFGGRRRRRRGNKHKNEEAKQKKFFDSSIRTIIENLCSALADKNKDLFLSLFSEDDPQICHPVGILKEKDIPGYFDRFVLVYHSLWPALNEGSVVVDLSHVGAHCEVAVTTQYTDASDAMKYTEPQHWHFDFSVRQCSLPTYESLKHPSKNKRESLEAPAYELFIKKWHVYCSLAKYKKLNNRTTADLWKSIVTWTKLGSTYGATYLNNHLADAFSVEKEPTELTTLLTGLNDYSPEKLKAVFATKIRMVVVEGLFSYRHYSNNETKAPEDESFIVSQIILRNLQKHKVQKIRCESVFRCGKHISARVTLNLNKGLVPGFILMKVSGKRDTSAKNKILELLLCSSVL